jgi:hypothetical protein
MNLFHHLEERMNANLLKYFASIHRNVGEQDVDHANDGRTDYDLNLGSEQSSKTNYCR